MEVVGLREVHALLEVAIVDAHLAPRAGVRERLGRRDHPSHVEVFSFGSATPTAHDIVELLARRGAHLVLTEGGPHLIGQLLQAGLLDELFLTISPQVVGRSNDTPRLALVEDAVYTVETAPWFDLADLRRNGDHLFSRYRSKGAAQ